MELIFKRKRLNLGIVLSIILAVFVSFAFGSVSEAASTDSKEEAEELAKAIYNSSDYDKETRTFDFDEEKAISLGLNEQMAKQMNDYFTSLSPDEAEKVYEEQENAMNGDGNQTMVAPLIAWAAGVLAAAGLSWLANKLLDYGAEKFCNAYEDSNAVTEEVCEVIAP